MSNIVTIQKQATAIQTNFAPSNFQELMKFAEFASRTSLVPKIYHGKPSDILIAVQMGGELGLAPMQSLQNISVINGKPSIYGDAMLAICRSSPLCEYVKEEITGDKQEEWVAICTVKRKGNPEVVRKFSWKQAVNAKLIEKALKPNSQGWVNENAPWLTYPDRMLQMRARGFALRDAFPDLLSGLVSKEEAQDYPTQQHKSLNQTPIQTKEPEVFQDVELMPEVQSEPQQQKTKLEKQYDAAVSKVNETRTKEELKELTSKEGFIKMREELNVHYPNLNGVLNTLITGKVKEFHAENEEELQHAV